jgi:hypothetical protein
VNSPYKEEFIKKIMELDEDCQTHFMFFIQKSMGEGDSPLFDPSIKVENREALILRTEKQRMAVQIQELLNEHNELKAQYTKLTQEKDELLLVITDLKSELSRKTKPAISQYTADSNDVELRLSEKEVKIMQLTNHLNEVKKSSEKEISRLKDEIDIANSKVISLTQAEKNLQRYKKQVETLSTVKIQLQELQNENRDLKEQIEMKEIEIENTSSLKRTIKMLKDDIATERKNAENYSYKLENTKKEMKKKESEIEELKEKVLFAEARIKDIEAEHEALESAQNSEDSVGFNKLSEMEEACKTPVPLELKKEATRKLTINPDIELARKEKLVMQFKLNKAKAKKKEFREGCFMLAEEMSQRVWASTQKASQLENKLHALTDQLQQSSQNVANAQNDKLKYDQCVYELEQVKLSKENLTNEVTKLYQEKDQTYQKLISCREEIMSLQNQMNEKDVQLRQKDYNEKILNEKLQALAEREKASHDIIENFKHETKEGDDVYKIKFIDNERELIELKSEKQEMLFRLAEKEERIEEVLRDKAEKIKVLENEHKDAIKIMREENNRRTTQIINQCDEAITELQNERELIAAQLKLEKKTSLEWKKSIGMEWGGQGNKEDVKKLKEELNKKEKEIIKLTKANQEVKRCWKESNKLLKTVWKEIGEQTQKIQNATKKYT